MLISLSSLRTIRSCVVVIAKRAYFNVKTLLDLAVIIKGEESNTKSRRSLRETHYKYDAKINAYSKNKSFNCLHDAALNFPKQQILLFSLINMLFSFG